MDTQSPYPPSPQAQPSTPQTSMQAPNMGFNPSEMVTITNSKTNQIKQVQRSQLPQYGLPSNYQSQADIRAQAIINGNAPSSNADAATLLVLNQKGFKDPNSAQAKAAQAKTDAYGKVKSSIQNQLDTYKSLPTYDKGQFANVNNIPFIQGLTQGGEYEKQKQALGATLKEVAGAGGGSGVRITQSELNNWANLLPGIHKSDAQNKQDITLLDKQLKSSFGQGLDPEYLQQFNAVPGKTPAQSVSSGPSVGGLIKNAGTDIKNNVNGLLGIPANVINTVKTAYTDPNPQKRLTAAQSLYPNNVQTSVGKGIVNEFNNLLGKPLEGGDVAGRIAQNAYNRPVSTALDVLPFLSAGKAALAGKAEDATGLKFADGSPATMGEDTGALKFANGSPATPGMTIGQIQEAAQRARGVPLLAEYDQAARTGNTARMQEIATQIKNAPVDSPYAAYKNTFANVSPVATNLNPVATKLNPVANLVKNATDAVNGGGSKEYVARQANNANMLPQNQVLMDKNILMHPTETGRIQATSQSLNDVGSQLQQVYQNSDRIFKGDELGTLLDTQLKAKGYDPRAIGFIKNYINQQGGFDIGSNDSLIPMDKAWQTAKTLENNPPKMLKNPESAGAYKQLSNDTARIIRQQLGTKLPETQSLNAQYGALRDYMDNRLTDPQGLNANGGKSGMGIVGTAVKVGKDVLNPIANSAYKLSQPMKLFRDKRTKIGNVQFRGQ